MKRYCIKCEPGRVEYMDILRETSDGFMIRLTRIKDDYEKTLEEFMSRQLFKTCLNTGYIYEIDLTTATSVA
ncbi:MAG: hypothetical protein LBD78_10700 [Spirochaetaceae bacterium]|jgi:hypothetical protein|nr:hypothetical protein [Spirochaetaceae bacterium]